MARSTVKNILQKAKNAILGPGRRASAIEYWEKRAKKYGIRSVMNIEHSEEEFSAVTRMQKQELFPFLKQQLIGNERIVLDLGCGPGRFTIDIADMVQGKAIGVDPIQCLIDLAPSNENVEWRVMTEGIIPVEDDSIDLAWICLVLGGIIDDRTLSATLSEIDRVLKKGGLIFLAENTSDKKDGDYWKFRSIQTYQTLFGFSAIRHLSDYFDKGERISIMAGRKNV